MSLYKISFVTLFPEQYEGFLKTSIIKRAIENKHVDVEVINFREYSLDKHQKVDDYAYGGGSGMVLMLQPIVDCLKAIKTPQSKTILLSPCGQPYHQKIAKRYKNETNHLIIVCGHYEGFDERIKNYIDEVISIGDYVLTGGELPSMVIADSVIRLLDGVISQGSLLSESFDDDLLDYPVYTKPVVYDGYEVPSVLVNGNHKKIAEYRKAQQIILTKQNRKDLYRKYLNKEKKDNVSNKN